MNRKLINLIREEFYKRTKRKTGWGKKELEVEFEAALADACARYIDETEAQRSAELV